MLFDLARHHAPSTIFLDEIDAIISQRGEARSEHESSRRLKTELLIQVILDFRKCIEDMQKSNLLAPDVSLSLLAVTTLCQNLQQSKANY